MRLFDYATEFAQPFREAIRAHAERVAAEEGVEVQYIRKPRGYRKEDRIREIIAKRGTHPGLVHVFSVMELCSSYRPWHDKRTGMTHLRPDGGKCVYYYFYFIDEVLGLCFLSVPTWCPFRAQFYFNGHNWLALKLKAARVSFELQDNAIVAISNWRKAQDLADNLAVAELHTRLDAAVARYVPDLEPLDDRGAVALPVQEMREVDHRRMPPVGTLRTAGELLAEVLDRKADARSGTSRPLRSRAFVG